jgi:WD40-like Beta Propeller Repeat
MQTLGELLAMPCELPALRSSVIRKWPCIRRAWFSRTTSRLMATSCFTSKQPTTIVRICGLFQDLTNATSQREPSPYLRSSSNQFNAQFSPDGKWIAYTSDESGRQQVYVQSFPASTEAKWQVSIGGGDFARWRRDGKELFYRALDGKLMVASVGSAGQGLQFGTPVVLFPIFESAGQHTYPYDVAPDGKRILTFAKDNNDSTILQVLLN